MSTQVEPPTASSGTAAANPFIGLRRFEMEDSDLFFGRDEQTHELLRRLRMLHFVAVMGPSGCGKSSLIRAGVLAALRDGYLLGDDDEEWQIVITQPGNGPLEAWVRDLQPVKRAGAADAELLANPVAAIDTSRGPVVLLVDQFEELFQVSGEDRAAGGCAGIHQGVLATGEAGGRVYAILTMRSEYLAHCAQHPRCLRRRSTRECTVRTCVRNSYATRLFVPCTSRVRRSPRSWWTGCCRMLPARTTASRFSSMH